MNAIPGLPVAGRPAAPRPVRLIGRPGVLLSGPADLAGHRRRWGPVPRLDLTGLAAAATPLVGAGGAEFPTSRKLHSLAGGGVAAVVVNAMEGEPASAKDHLLLQRAPHQVLDGAAAAAHALGTRRAIIRIAQGPLLPRVEAAIAERDDLRWSVSIGPEAFVAGEASAIARALRGGPALPDGQSRPPMIGRVHRRPILLSNAETFARLGVAARGDTRTSALLTVSGAVELAGVVELPCAATLGDVLDLSAADEPSVLVTGGWHGAWLPWRPELRDVALRREAVRAAGGRWGAGVLVVLGWEPHPVHVLDAVADMLAAQSARQCGPCVRGLPAMAEAIHARCDPDRIGAWLDGRGLCAHPTAAAAALISGAAAVQAVSRELAG